MIVFDDRVTSVFSIVLTTDVVSTDDVIGEDAWVSSVELKVVVGTNVDDTVDVVGDPHITLRFPNDPSGIPRKKVISLKLLYICRLITSRIKS